MSKWLIFLSVVCLSLFGIIQVSYAQLSLDVESGAVFTSYNRIGIPGNSGTRFDLNDQVETDNRFFYRLKLLYTINDKHTISALYAPLSIEGNGFAQEDIMFAGESFLQGDPLLSTYKFNSYRLTYRYMFPRKGDWQFGLGATAKIRDAKIMLEDGEKSASKTNVGFVPLINFQLEWFARENLSFLLQGDALASPQGRAEDVLLAALLHPSQNVTLKAGYRILEGGADNDEVYNFSMIHYALIGGIFTF